MPHSDPLERIVYPNERDQLTGIWRGIFVTLKNSLGLLVFVNSGILIISLAVFAAL